MKWVSWINVTLYLQSIEDSATFDYEHCSVVLWSQKSSTSWYENSQIFRVVQQIEACALETSANQAGSLPA